MRIHAKIALALLIVVAFLAIGAWCRHIVGPRIVARTVTPEGFELCIVQQSSWDALPWFKTSFVSRRQGNPWQRFYFHHEDSFWRNSRVALDTNTQVATFFRGNAPVVSYAWATGAYTNLHRHRADTPQEMPSGWSPQMLVP